MSEMCEIREGMYKKDTENKKFTAWVFGIGATIATAAITVLAESLRENSRGNSRSNNNRYDDYKHDNDRIRENDKTRENDRKY